MQHSNLASAGTASVMLSSSQPSSITARMAALQLQSTSAAEGTDVPAGTSQSKSRSERPYASYDGLFDAPSLSTMGHNYTPPHFRRVSVGPSQSRLVPDSSMSHGRIGSLQPNVDVTVGQSQPRESVADGSFAQPDSAANSLFVPSTGANAPIVARSNTTEGSSQPAAVNSDQLNVFNGPYGSWTTRDPYYLSMMQSSRPTSAPASTTILSTSSHGYSTSGTPTSTIQHVGSASNSPSMLPVSAIHRSQGGGLGASVPLSMFQLSDPDRTFLSNRLSFNAVPVLRCQPPRDMIDPLPHLPRVLVRVVKQMKIGEHVTLMRDPMSFVPLELQCQCKQFVCQYQAVCECDDENCPWPDELHDPSFVPIFSQSLRKNKVIYQEENMGQ